MEEIWFWYSVAFVANIMAVFYVWSYSAVLNSTQKVLLITISISVIVLLYIFMFFIFYYTRTSYNVGE